MNNPSMQLIYKIGSLFILGLKLQGYFLCKLLSGGIILGVFPALLGVYRIIYQYLTDKDNSNIKITAELKKVNKKEFWQINLLGYLLLMMALVLLINLNISRQHIQNGLLHLLLLIFTALFLGACHFIIPIYAKYDLPLKQYIYQSFLFFLINIMETLAMILGVAISVILCLLIPIFGFFTGIPLVLVPYVWFSKVAIEKAEALFYVEDI